MSDFRIVRLARLYYTVKKIVIRKKNIRSRKGKAVNANVYETKDYTVVVHWYYISSYIFYIHKSVYYIQQFIMYHPLIPFERYIYK